MFGITDFSFNILTGYPFVTILFFMFLALLAVYLYRRTNPPLSAGKRLLLVSLRMIAVIALFLALLEPVVSYNREYDRKPHISVLVDRSGSMTVDDNGSTREQSVDSILNSPGFSEFLDNFDITLTEFASGIISDKDSANINLTALGEVLNAQSQSELGGDADYWLLFSDGISNSGVSPATVAERLNVPIYTVGIGLEEEQRDLALKSIEHNDLIFAGKPAEITIGLEWAGMNNDHAKISIFSDNKRLTEETTVLSSGQLQKELKLKFIPEKPGRQTFRIEAAEIDGEASIDNNSRSFAVTVLKSKLKVLLVSEKLDWEYSFLNRFLLRAENIDHTPVVFKKGGGYLTGPFPERQTELNRYDLIILYDVSARSLSSRSELFHSFLADKGGGILAFLGRNYVSSGHPRWIDEFLPFAAVTTRRDILNVRVNGEPSENLLFHPAVRIADSRAAIRARWQELPPFETITLVDSIMPNSDILVQADIGSRISMPVLGYRHFGAGKVLAITAAPFWHWSFLGYGFGEEPTEYPTFFDGVINWLALKEDFDPIRIVPDQSVYNRGEPVGFGAFVYDLGFRPIEGAAGYVSLVNTEKSDSALAQWVDLGEGQYDVDFGNISPGNYNYYGVVKKDGQTLREAEGQIMVESYYIEDFRHKPDFGTLEAVSRYTGGEFGRVSEADKIFGLMDPTIIRESNRVEIVIWNKIWLLVIFIAALGIEWVLRKNFQLV